MSADAIEAFLDEIRADPRGGLIDEQFEEIMRDLYRSDDPATIELCDSVCAAVRRKDLTLLNRLTKLLPILSDYVARAKD